MGVSCPRTGLDPAPGRRTTSWIQAGACAPPPPIVRPFLPPPTEGALPVPEGADPAPSRGEAFAAAPCLHPTRVAFMGTARCSLGEQLPPHQPGRSVRRVRR